MTRQEQLEWCKKCINRHMSFKQGIVCKRTNKYADFEMSCPDFQLDETVNTTEVAVNEPEIPHEQLIAFTDDRILNRLRTYQDFYYAITGGTLAMLGSAILWAIITVAIQYQAAYMAIGLGLAVGLAVRFFGAGIDKKFGYLGGALSLLGCLLGNLLSQVGFIAHEYSLGYLETITYLNGGIIVSILIETFHPIDLIFYGFAIYQGYRFAFRKISPQLINAIDSGKTEEIPPYFQFRFPLVIISIIVLSLIIIQVSRGVNGPKTYYYESGSLMSEGELKRSKEHGQWTLYYESGTVFCTGYYQKGEPDGNWNWYDENGALIRSGSYRTGFEHGPWISYTNTGNLIDSIVYVNGRKNGFFFVNYENGQRAQQGFFNRDLKCDVWEFYYESGQLRSIGLMHEDELADKWIFYYENGAIEKETFHIADSLDLIMNAWDREGNQLVADGNGYYKSYSADGTVLSEGVVTNGKRTGIWINYYDDGRIHEEGTYENNMFVIHNSWDINKVKIVKNGFGTYTSYFSDNESIYELGEIQNGIREGKWTTYHASTGIPAMEANYKNGKFHGESITYYESGEILSIGMFAEGKMNGTWNWYYEDGSIASTARLIHNKKEGRQVFYSERGLKKREEFYKDGILVKEKW